MTDKLRVAIVDDTPDMRLLVRLSLELDPDIEIVAEAQDGREAIEVADRHRPEVMLLDLAMPVMDGMQALPHIVRSSPETRVLVLSGFAADTMERDAVAAGAAAYLQKGVAAMELCDHVWHVAGRRRPHEEVPEPAAEPTGPTGPTGPPVDDGATTGRMLDLTTAGILLVGRPAGVAFADAIVLAANPAAFGLMGLTDDPAGCPLDELAPGLTPSLVDVLARLDGDAPGHSERVRGPAGELWVSLRSLGSEVVVTLVRAPD